MNAIAFSRNESQFSQDSLQIVRQTQKFIVLFGALDVIVSALSLANGDTQYPILGLIIAPSVYIAVKHKDLATGLVRVMIGGIGVLAVILVCVIVYNFILPPFSLTTLRFETQPIVFMWHRLGLGYITFLLLVQYKLWMPCVVNDVVRSLPSVRYLIGKEWKPSRHLFAVVFLAAVAYLFFKSTIETTLTGKYNAKAVEVVSSSLGSNQEQNKKTYYVDWLNAAYNSTDGTVKVTGRVTVYDGQTLKSVPVEWLEKH